MEFLLGYLVGVFAMLFIEILFKKKLNRDIEKLKDFDTWKEWKNKTK